MKLVLITPANILFMPYLNNYIKILTTNKVKFDVINWDRMNIEDDSKFTYKDKKNGHQRTIIDYLKFKSFVLKILKENEYDKVIIFGLQLTFYFSRLLKKQYNENYVIDIRDYNKIIKYINMDNVINFAQEVVISSQGFQEWLPKRNYIINHNTSINKIEELEVDFKIEECKHEHEKITISYIGSIRDLDINIKLINSLRNNEKISLYYHGQGIVNNELISFVNIYKINNVTVTGKYEKHEEINLYNHANLINIVLSNNINSRTLLPNRLYSALQYGKPIITNKGTFLSNVVEKYNLGIVVNDFNNVEQGIVDFFNEFQWSQFKDNRKIFFEKIIMENKAFEDSIIKYIKKQDNN